LLQKFSAKGKPAMFNFLIFKEMITCKCPANAALTAIPSVTCTETFGQIQKIAFQRLSSNGTLNKFDSTTEIGKLASWSTFLAAADSTKIVVSPYINAPTQEAGAARTFGGGNESLNGIEEILGREPSAFTAQLRKMPQNVIAIMKELECEAAANNLGVFLFDEAGRIEALVDKSVATTFYPIPVQSLFVGDKVHGGLEAPDSNALQFSFLPNYSDQLRIVVPDDFNPLTDL
jgi:hypothetical protein